jgi:hypothetical protein
LAIILCLGCAGIHSAKYRERLRRLEHQNEVENIEVRYNVCNSGNSDQYDLEARMLKVGWERDKTCDTFTERTIFRDVTCRCWVLKPGHYKAPN